MYCSDSSASETSATQCPHCETVFRVTRIQLDAAHNRVRCGTCMQLFLAETYHAPSDHSPATGTIANSPTTPAAAGDEDTDEPVFEFSECFLDTESAPGPAQSSGDTAEHQREQTERDSGGSTDASPAPAGAAVDDRQHDTEPTQPPADPAPPAAPPSAKWQRPIDHYTRQEQRRNAGSRYRRLMSAWTARRAGPILAAAVICSAALLSGGRYFWHHDTALARIPLIRSSVESWCEQVQCALPAHLASAEAQVSGLTVYRDPLRQEMLYVDATLSNDSRHQLAFPGLTIELSDRLSGSASTHFISPSDYLNDAREASFIPPRQAVQITFSLQVPDGNASDYRLALSKL